MFMPVNSTCAHEVRPSPGVRAHEWFKEDGAVTAPAPDDPLDDRLLIPSDFRFRETTAFSHVAFAGSPTASSHSLDSQCQAK